MCCETHDLRSFILKYRQEDEHLAGADNRRCRCTELGKWRGQACVMEADGEDLLCAWCRETDHASWYAGTASSRNPAVAEYYAQRPNPGYASAYPAGNFKMRLSSGPSPAGEFRDEAASFAAPADGRRLDELEDRIRRGLAAPDAYGNIWSSAEGYTRSGPQNAQWTDYEYSSGSSAFRLSPEATAEMRASLTAGPVTAGQVQRYLMRKYGGSIGP